MKDFRPILLLLFILLFGHLNGQNNNDEPIAIIELRSNNSGPFLNELPDISQTTFEYDDTAKFKIKIADLNQREAFHTLFVSDAEIQEMTVGSQRFHAGKYQAVKQLSKKWDYRHFTLPTELLNQSEITVKCYNLTKKSFIVSPQIFPYENLQKGLIDLIKNSKTGILFTIFFLGGIFIFIVYTIGLTIQTRNPDFRFYAYYLGAILLHNLIQADAFLKIYTLFPSNPIWYHHLNEFLQMFIYAFFMLFIKIFLELKENHPEINRFVNASIIATIIFSIVFLFTSVATKNFDFIQNYLSILWIVVAILGTIIVITVIRKSDNPVTYFILAGGIFLLIGSVLELVSSLNLIGGYNWNLYAIPKNAWYPFNFTQLAILAETVFFALGIGYKIRMREKVYLNIKQNEITDLKSKEEQRELEKKMLEKELTALRSQMNPHFLFNSLASINDYIMHEKPQDASKYLTKFAKLMRIILNNSKQKTVSLQGELEAIKLYVELESLRFQGKFEFLLEVDPGIAISNIEIPSMILQPYIENAIKHGFVNLDSGGQLDLRIKQNKDNLTIEIEDNGIGRAKSREMKSEIEKGRKSHGLDITANRIDLINKLYDTNIRVQIIDKLNSGNPAGTKVELIVQNLKKN